VSGEPGAAQAMAAFDIEQFTQIGSKDSEANLLGLDS
jgi:hypothetical protein